MNSDDIAAAKAVKAVLGIYDGSTQQPADGSTQQPAADGKKPGEIEKSDKDAKPTEAKKEGGKGGLPDELNPQAKPVNAQVDSGSQALKDKFSLSTLTIDGQRVAVDDPSTANDASDPDLLDQDLVQITKL